MSMYSARHLVWSSCKDWTIVYRTDRGCQDSSYLPGKLFPGAAWVSRQFPVSTGYRRNGVLQSVHHVSPCTTTGAETGPGNVPFYYWYRSCESAHCETSLSDAEFGAKTDEVGEIEIFCNLWFIAQLLMLTRVPVVHNSWRHIKARSCIEWND